MADDVSYPFFLPPSTKVEWLCRRCVRRAIMGIPMVVWILGSLFGGLWFGIYPLLFGLGSWVLLSTACALCRGSFYHDMPLTVPRTLIMLLYGALAAFMIYLGIRLLIEGGG